MMVSDNRPILTPMETLTPQQAWERIRARQTRDYIGLDRNYLAHYLFEGDEVSLLTYDLEEGHTLSEILNGHWSEITRQIRASKNILLMLYCGENSEVLINDINGLAPLANAINDSQHFAWDIENTDSSDYRLQTCLFFVK